MDQNDQQSEEGNGDEIDCDCGCDCGDQASDDAGDCGGQGKDGGVEDCDCDCANDCADEAEEEDDCETRAGWGYGCVAWASASGSENGSGNESASRI